MTLLERYIGGEYTEIWAEMVSGTDQFGQPIANEDAEAVAEETMRRVRANIETLVTRLNETGYEFGVYADGTPISYPPVPLGSAVETDETMQAVSKIVGGIPLSLRAFYRHVGSVCLVGRYVSVESWDYTDPLWVDPFDAEQILINFEDWKSEVQEYGRDGTGPFCLEFAPDELCKDNASGGAPYGIELPCGEMDAIVANEWRNTTFVNYLRICFAWGGFPGFAGESDGKTWNLKNSKTMPPQIDLLRTGLLPI